MTKKRATNEIPIFLQTVFSWVLELVDKIENAEKQKEILTSIPE